MPGRRLRNGQIGQALRRDSKNVLQRRGTQKSVLNRIIHEYRQVESKEIKPRREASVRLLLERRPLLLALRLRFSYLPGLHERKPVGHDVQ